MTQPADILFYVQHLLGIGHLRRAATAPGAAGGRRIVVASGCGSDHGDREGYGKAKVLN